METSDNQSKPLSTLVKEYRRRGYLKLTARFSPREAAAWQRECDRLWDVACIDGKDPGIQWRGHRQQGRVPDRFDPVIDRSPLFEHLTRDERILGLVQSLLSTDAVLMKDKLITKRPDTLGYAMHQDYVYWRFMGIPPGSILSVQVSIDSAGRENGALELFPGLHDERLPAPDNDPLDVDETTMDLSRGEIVETRPGDLLFFHSLAPHRSAPNTSTASRRALYLSYAACTYASARERYYQERPQLDVHKGTSKNAPKNAPKNALFPR